MSDQLTPWFDGDVKPVREGWYEAKESSGNVDAENWWFDGVRWRDRLNGFVCSFQKRPWRGLASDPSKESK